MKFSASILAWALFVGATLGAPLLGNVEDPNNGTINIVKRAGPAAGKSDLKKGLLCESTKGVEEIRGYFPVGKGMKLWFWYFSARSDTAKDAPLVVWLNGGPGASSMGGLFQDNGPCQFSEGSTSPSRNPNSFNNVANMLYIDQPAGAGFSFGSDKNEVNGINTSRLAIKYVYEFLQEFLAHKEFAHLAKRKFGIATSSYGGHWGPELAVHIQEQNKKAKTKINLAGLAINSGLFDLSIQYPAMVEYSLEKKSIDKAKHDKIMKDYKTKCEPLLAACKKTDKDEDCSKADDACYPTVEEPLEEVREWVYDVRGNKYKPSVAYKEWLKKSAKEVGALVEFSGNLGETNDIFNRFTSTGDTARSMMSQLSEVVKANIPTLLWVGDQDALTTYIGVREVAEAVVHGGQAAFKKKVPGKWTVKGKEQGLFKTQGKLSYLQLKNAGHNVQFGQPENSLQAFTQFFGGKGTISSS
ncbi:unnamed protein product [Periconia digitata]|uniref:Uncharacterized protein n=1 Tax=Periconia digitata TaxID=1303443 RepID=A0A9W4UQH4_9PLEO|nr:unnamed protein product [Periconia digitata]